MSKNAYIDVDEKAIVMELSPEMSERKVKSTIHRAAKLERKFGKKMEKDAGFADSIEYGSDPKVIVKGLYQEREQKSFDKILKDELSNAERKRNKLYKTCVHPGERFDTEDKEIMVITGILSGGLFPAAVVIGRHRYTKANTSYNAIKYVDENKTYVPADAAKAQAGAKYSLDKQSQEVKYPVHIGKTK